jgi:hypothetical protein
VFVLKLTLLFGSRVIAGWFQNQTLTTTSLMKVPSISG